MARFSVATLAKVILNKYRLTPEAKIFTVNPEIFSLFDEEGKAFVQTGEYELSVGGGQPQKEGNPGRTSNCLTKRFRIIS